MRWIRKDVITKTGSSFILPILLVIGMYIILHGHLSPGGGFQGGVILAGGIALYYLSFRDSKFFSDNGKVKFFKIMEDLAAVIYLAIGLLGLICGGGFFTNILYKGNLGDLFSSGTIFAMNFAVGGKVLFGVGFLLLILLSTLRSKEEEMK